MHSGKWIPAFMRSALPLSILKTEAVCSSETVVTTYHTSGCQNRNLNSAAAQIVRDVQNNIKKFNLKIFL
jgi:hypothetical protein